MTRLHTAALLFASAALVVVDGAAARAQDAQITTSVDRQRIEIGEDIELSIAVSGQFEEFEQPSIDGFDVVSQGVQQVISNRQRSVTRTFVLRPKKSGQLTIGAARLKAGNRVVAEAPPITVTVTEPRPLTPVDAAAAQDLARMAEQQVFLRYATPRTRYYVGEPFPLTLELWLVEGLQYAGGDVVKGPSLDGLLAEDLPERPNVRPKARRIGDRRFSVYELSIVLATPLRAGSVLVDSATLDVGVSEDGWSLSAKKVRRSTQPFTLEVRDVPASGRPASFRSGNLGAFKLTASLNDDRGQTPTRVKTGQRIVLHVEVSGRGNLVALEAPTVEAGPGFEVMPLPAAGDDRISKDADGVTGSRTFQWIVSATKPGNVTTPTVSLGWWNPESERFEEARVPGKPLEVTGEAITGQQDDATAIGEDVGPIAESADLTRTRATPPAESPIYWSLVALPVLGWLFVEARWRRRRADHDNPGQRLSRGAGANAKKRLRAAEQALKDGLVKDFYGQLSRSLTSYLEERANIPATGMTHDQVRHAARQAGYPAELVDAVVVEMENCDFARFAPSGSAAEKMREAHARVSGVIDALDRIQPERRP